MKTAFVSGNVKGIGKYITFKLIELGFYVPIHYNKSQNLAIELQKEIKEKYNLDVDLFQADLTDYDQTNKIVDDFIKKYQKLDVLVNNVGDYLYKNLLDISYQEFKYIIDSNLMTAFILTQAFLNYIKESIIFMGFVGTNNIRANVNTTAYNIAKTGVLIYAKSLAKILAPKSINVNVIGLGVAENSVTKPINEIPFKRTATFDEINNLIEFFLKNKYVTGQLVELAGAWLL
ncbi:MAG: SDR family NAD(P)-dependent oxidoreductase [bacterium]|jgi:NAD(P)-dependent dehydrogenase (short-subunit alcohol dehydrogenase family)